MIVSFFFLFFFLKMKFEVLGLIVNWSVDNSLSSFL